MNLAKVVVLPNVKVIMYKGFREQMKPLRSILHKDILDIRH